jgi:glycosyltransferase involved in cell wall biosynthesis
LTPAVSLRAVTLLFVAMKLHGQHSFLVLWVNAFVARGYDVEVVLLEDRRELAAPVLGDEHATMPFRVHSLEKEKGHTKARQALRFLRLVTRLDYDRVFIHGTPVWGLLGSWYWIGKRVPTYLWYTHYTMHASLWVTSRYAKRLFCATRQSLPQYDGSPKKVVTGHGIDLSYWSKRENVADDPHRLLCVHRLSRSKRVELLLRALALLPDPYTLDIYGDELDRGYVAELRALAEGLGLQERVAFHGSAPSRELPAIYCRYRLILNMASETIDKTMLEAMTCGCYPVVTPRNANAVGIPESPAETPESIASFVDRYAGAPPLSADEMYRVVAERHSLERLVADLDAYIRPGI